MNTLPTLAEVADVLGRIPDLSLEIAYDAEVESQAQCCLTDDYNAALAAALVRRVARAIAIQNLPLGVVQDDLTGTTRVGGTDPEVRRLEAPYRKYSIA